MEDLVTLTKNPELVGDQSQYRPGFHELGVLLHSAVYAGLQSPINAVLQPFGDGKIAEKLPHINAPEPAKPWSLDWNLQQMGTGIGMLAPILATRKFVTTLAPSATAELATSKGLAALTTNEASSLARYELGVSVATGMAYGGVLSPSKLEPGQSLLDARLRQSTATGVTFGTLSLAGMGLKNIGSSSLLKDSTLGSILKNETASLALAGIPAGLVSVDAQSVVNGKGLPSLKDHFDSKYLEAIYNFSVVGAGLGYITAPHAAKRAPQRGLERAASDNSTSTVAELLPTIGERGALAESRIPNLDLSVVKMPEKLSYERDVRDLPSLKASATAHGDNGSPLSLARFEQQSLEKVPTPVRVYEVPGVMAKVIIPEEYALKLDHLSDLQQQAKGTGSAAEKAQLELAKPEMQDLAKRMNVEDAFKHALMTPEPGKFKEISLSDQSNPYDLWYKATTGNSNFSSTADTVFKTGETSWYKNQKGASLVEDTMHEWSHLFDEHNPLYAQIIRTANKVDNLDMRPYAKVPREQLAILLGENALHPDGARASQLIEAAPVTAIAIGEGMKNLLQRIPEGQRSPLHDQLMARADLLITQAGPTARQNLVELIQANAGTAEGQNALKALVFLGKSQDMQKLSSVTSVDLSHEPVYDAAGALIGDIPHPTSVDLSHTFVGVDTMRNLGGKPLENLNLEGTRVTNASMSYLPQTLKNLNVAGTKIGDQSIPFLQRLQSLESLDVSDTLISGAGMMKLQAALPHTRITD